MLIEAQSREFLSADLVDVESEWTVSPPCWVGPGYNTMFVIWESHYTGKADPNLKMLLPQPLECWDSMCHHTCFD